MGIGLLSVYRHQLLWSCYVVTMPDEKLAKRIFFWTEESEGFMNGIKYYDIKNQFKVPQKVMNRDTKLYSLE